MRYRVYGIDTETGGTIGVTYSAADCKQATCPHRRPTPGAATR